MTVRQLLTMDAGPAAGRPLGRPPDGRRQRLGEREAVRARRDALARARHRLRVLQLQLGGARARRSRRSPGSASRTSCASACSSRSALRSTVWSAGDLPRDAGRDGLPPGRRGLHGRGAAGRRRRLRGARRALQQRARPRALERRVPRRRAAARRARGRAREPRDAARDAARPQRVRARRRVAVAGGAARRGRRRLRLRPHDLARARRAAARRASGRPARIRHADALGARARAERDPARQRHLREVRGAGAARARAGRARGRAAAPDHPRGPRAAGGARGRRRARRSAGTTLRRRGCSRRTSTSTSRWASAAPSSRRCASATARSRATASSSPRTPCAARWRLRGERGHVELDITMAPTVPPLVQTLAVESVLPPSGLLGELAATAVQLASDPDAAALDGLLAARRPTPPRILRGLRVAAALYGPFGEPEPVAGDGETTTTLRLPSDARRRRPRAGARRERGAWRAHAAPRAAELGRAYIRVRHALCVPDPGLCD